jgi:hypothetical protein
MSQLQVTAERLRVRLAALEQPYLEEFAGLRERLALQDLSGRRDIWRRFMDERTFRRWLVLSDLHGQIEWSMDW